MTGGTPGPVLACPHCGAALRRVERAWRCGAGHSFDVARQGYVNLLAGPSPHVGDSAAMLDARAAVLAAGHLDVVTGAVLDVITRCGLPDGVIVEAGAGTAHHLVRTLVATGRSGVAMDVSTAAARRAARSSPAVTAVVADVWGPWPVLDGAAAAVLHVFAPRNPSEARRVLADDGLLLITVPTAGHLAELREPLGLLDTGDPARKLLTEPGLEPAGAAQGRALRHLTHDDVRAVVAMGPSAHHIDPQALTDRVARLPEPVGVTVAVDVVAWRRHG